MSNESSSHEAVGELPPDVFALLNAAVAKVPQGMIVIQNDGRILGANEAASAMLGYVDGDLVGRVLEDVIPRELNSGQRDFWVTAHQSTSNISQSSSIVIGRRKDGESIPLEVNSSIVPSTHPPYVILSFVDVTERLNMEARVAAATSEHAELDRLVADIAFQFAGTESANLDALIVESLRRLCDTLDLDHAFLCRKRIGSSVADATHFWIKPPYPSPPQPWPVASVPFVLSKVEAGEPAWFSEVDELSDPIDRETFRTCGTKSGAIVPLVGVSESGVLSAMALSSMSVAREWPTPIIERLRLIAGVISQALARHASEESLSEAVGEIDRLRDRLDGAVALKREFRDFKDAKSTRTSRLIVAESMSAKHAVAQIEQVASTPATVLLRGETGTGKEVFAQAIHDLSPRHLRQMVVVSCAAIPTALIESELFGRERGAYTGALSRQIGRFEVANQSTLFLDEIGDLPMEMQVKLLRVLQQRTIERLGSTQSIKVDVRIIAATHRDLDAAVREGTFREDLFYRLNVFPVVVPPLRERTEDIPGLVWTFVDEFSRAFGKTIDSISKESLRELQGYQWPGNVRELRNVIERAVILSASPQLEVSVPRQAAHTPQAAMTLEALEAEHIRKVLESTNWRVRGTGGAAQRLGLKPTTLESRMARLGISRKHAS